MKLPILEFDDEESVINKNSYLQHIVNVPENYGNMSLIKKHNIDCCLFVFSKEELPFEKDLEICYRYMFGSNTNNVYSYKNKFLIAIAPLGGPAAAGIMEELGILGISKFVACGSAGLINHNIDATAFMLVERAIRDEGTSYKYEKPAVYSYPDIELTNLLATFLKKQNLNYIKTTTWTTDAFFRETPTRIKKRQKQGAIVVEMECASWCSVAKFYGYKFAQLLYTSDITKQGDWAFKSKEDRAKLKNQIIQLMIDFVEEYIEKK